MRFYITWKSRDLHLEATSLLLLLHPLYIQILSLSLSEYPLLHFFLFFKMSGLARHNPRTLRDFLRENPNSCPSNEFKSFPRKPIPPTTMRSLIEMDLNSSSSLCRSSNPRILHSLLNAVVKRFSSFAAAKPPSILPRSLSRKLSRRSGSRNTRGSEEIKITVRIKDIVRWRSFRDLAEEEVQPPPLDFSSSSTSCSSSKGSSWSESDFSCGSCEGSFVEIDPNDVAAGKGFSPLVGKDSVHATTGTAVWAKGDLTSQEEELKSPVSVLQIGEDKFSPYGQSLANFERRNQKCMQTIQRLESLTNLEGEEQGRIEKTARELLHCVEATGSVPCRKAILDQVLFDFFRDELRKRGNYQTGHDEFEWEIQRTAQDWVHGVSKNDLENSDKEACVRDMDRRERWSKFEEEQEELAWEIESAILENLVDEMLNGFSSD